MSWTISAQGSKSETLHSLEAASVAEDQPQGELTRRFLAELVETLPAEGRCKVTAYGHHDAGSASVAVTVDCSP